MGVLPIASIEVSYAATISIDADDIGPFYCTLTGNAVLAAPSNGVNGQTITMDFIQDGTGSRTLDVSAFVIPVDATTPVQPTAANSRGVLVFRKFGSTWFITTFLKYAS